MGFSKAAQLWLENHSRVRKSPGAHKLDQGLVASLSADFGNSLLEEISPESVEQQISRKMKTGLKPATINRYLQALRAILNYYIKKRHLTFNVVSIVGLLPEIDTHYDYLSFEEADRFLIYTNQKYTDQKRWIYRLYLLALNTGLRWGEIIALRWDKIDFYKKTIIVARSYCNASKQIRETTKGRKVRYVGMNSSLLPELSQQYQERSAGNPFNLVFPNHGKTIDLKNFKRDCFEKDLKAAGIRRIRFHDLRHTFASHFMMKGGNLYDLQKLMGHSGITTTERYAHLSTESVVAKNELVAIDGIQQKVIDLQAHLKKQAS